MDSHISSEANKEALEIIKLRGKCQYDYFTTPKFAWNDGLRNARVVKKLSKRDLNKINAIKSYRRNVESGRV